MIDLSQLLQKIEKYKAGITYRGYGTLIIPYSNDYINLICVEHSNNWTNIRTLTKQWSFIIDIKKGFTNLSTFKDLEKNISINVTPVRKGKNKGSFGIRIYEMKAAPDEQIVKDILNYIFS